jgi:2-polyprenyl-3-methyl-5-hydroxy-6-metoxy-1,4-benzoquinol methylase
MWNKIKRLIRARIVKRWGIPASKRRVWDTEFASGQWNYLEHTEGDPIYAYLEKYLERGNILDLGCGSGNTGNELDYSSYQSYTGADVSEVAIRKAELRTRKNKREAKNEYVCCDIESFVPSTPYTVILFRESIFYIPVTKIKAILDRYAGYLRPDGVFVVRMCDREKYHSIVELIIRHYLVLERRLVENALDIIIVFKPFKLNEETSLSAGHEITFRVDEGKATGSFSAFCQNLPTLVMPANW